MVLGAAAASAQDGPILYTSDDPRIAEVREGVENGSQESQRIERAFVGDWIYRHEIAKANVGFRWTSLHIQSEGTLVIEYQTNGSDSEQTLAGPFEFIHKGTDQQLPGKRPAVLVTVESGAPGIVLPLVELTVDYDSRVPASWGKVLKFQDLDGNEFVFSNVNPLRDLYQFDSWVGQTKVHYERTVTNWVPDFAALSATNFLLRNEGVWTNSQKYCYYVLEAADALGKDVILRIWESQDVTNAHLAMLDFFSTAQAPQPFPLGSALGVDIGDRCYLGWGVVGDNFAFVRNNVFVWVFGEGSVLELARKLDCELVRHSFTGPVLLQPGISDGAFHVSVPTTTTNTYVLESSDSPSGTNWTAFPPFAGDGTIRLIAYPAWSSREFFRIRLQ